MIIALLTTLWIIKLLKGDTWEEENGHFLNRLFLRLMALKIPFSFFKDKTDDDPSF